MNINTKATLAKNSQSGFSLVELMIVVAIIGILSSIAVPQFQRFIFKARQTEAKTALSSLYTAEKAFFAEWSLYHDDFGALGYLPEGKIYYGIGFGATRATVTGYSGGGATAKYSTFEACSGSCTKMPTHPAAVPAATCTVTNVTTAGSGMGSTFIACANAVGIAPTSGSSGSGDDDWTMTESRVLSNGAPAAPTTTAAADPT